MDLVLHVIVFTDSHDMNMILVCSVHNYCSLMVELGNASMSYYFMTFHKHLLNKSYTHIQPSLIQKFVEKNFSYCCDIFIIPFFLRV